ncbi:MAG: polyprenyl synthetase family protein, partial [Atopobium sp.]|nr:polyprenyl synthetase family protein [Atopobium sp.]
DIADKSELRRGEKCLYKTLGTGLAINVGDSALVNVVRRVTVADRLSDQLKVRVIDALLAMQEHTLEGQALDLGWAQNERWDITSEQYLFMALSKTAYYSAAYPLVLGALIGGADQKTLDALKEFGLKVGLAFQLQDDLLNLVGNAQVQGKDFRSDITEGKRTLAVVYALEHLGPAEKTELVSILSAHTSDTLKLQRAVELMESANAIKFVRTHALALVDEAKHVLENVILTEDARDTLLSMADFFVNRER